MVAALATLAVLPSAAQAQSPYADLVASTPGLTAYWRLGEPTGTVADDAKGAADGTYVGGPALGARGALSADADTAARFDGVDDEMQAGAAATGTLEGWFFWEAGVALMRDSTTSGGWIATFDSGGRVAYRVAGTTFMTPLATADVRDGWHHVALTVAGGATAFYLDGALVHSGTGAGAAGPVMPWHVMRNGTTTQYARGRADEVAVYGSSLPADDDRRALRGRARRDRHHGARCARRPDRDGPARPRRARLERRARMLDGYDVFRATSAAGPFSRVNPSRLSASAFTDTTVTGGTTYVYAVTAERRGQQPQPALAPGVRDTALHRRPPARVLAVPALRDPGDLLRRLGGRDDRQLRGRLASELPRRAAARGWPRPTRPTRWRTSRSPSSAIRRTPTGARPPRPTTSTPPTPTTSRTPSACGPPATATACTGER